MEAAGRAGDESEHGLESLIEILGFIIGLINSEGEGGQSDLNVFGLELMNVALSSGTSGEVPVLQTCMPSHLKLQHWIAEESQRTPRDPKELCREHVILRG